MLRFNLIIFLSFISTFSHSQESYLDQGKELKAFFQDIEGIHNTKDYYDYCRLDILNYLDDVNSLPHNRISVGSSSYMYIWNTINFTTLKNRILKRMVYWGEPDSYNENKGSLNKTELVDLYINERKLKGRIEYSQFIKVKHFIVFEIIKKGSTLFKFNRKVYKKGLLSNKLIDKIECTY